MLDRHERSLSSDDPRISVYNFLRYSDRRWRIVNSSLHFQNRLRARDYRALFVEAGLEVAHEERRTPGAEHREQLKQLRLAPRFARGYTLEDLEPSDMWSSRRTEGLIFEPRDLSAWRRPGAGGR